MALAVPVQLSQQGRLLDANSVPVEGNHVLTIHLYDASVNGNFVWGENISVVFYNDFYQILLGSDISNPLDSDLLDQDVLYIEMQIDGNTPLQPRQKLTSVPYAKRADVAKNIDGGVVNATEISINGNVVLDSSGSFVGQSTP